MMSVLLFFVDGLGIGSRGPANPFDGLADAAPLAIFKDEPATSSSTLEGIMMPTDACLGVVRDRD